MELSTYHPFKSAEAREEYLAFYDRRAKQWPVASETKLIETAYGQTSVRISGAENTQPLVLLHGYEANSLLWTPNIQSLSVDYKTYAVDNIFDNGRSIYTRPLKSLDDLMAWLDELLTALEANTKVSLIGQSYGGWLSKHYAIRFPQRVAKIVLLTPAGTLPMAPKCMLRWMLSFGHHPKFFRIFMYWVFGDLSQVNEPTRKFIEEMVDDMLLASRCFLPRPFVFPANFTDKDLQSIQVPALYMVGENERLYSAHKAVQRLNQVAPQIKTEIIPQAGHNMTIKQAGKVNPKILEFLKQP